MAKNKDKNIVAGKLKEENYVLLCDRTLQEAKEIAEKILYYYEKTGGKRDKRRI